MEWAEWFEANKDELAKLLEQDAEEALFKAYLAGIKAMGKYNSQFSPSR